jgi:hypothetical protein
MAENDIATAVIADSRARNQSTALSEETWRRRIYQVAASLHVIGYIEKPTKHEFGFVRFATPTPHFARKSG